MTEMLLRATTRIRNAKMVDRRKALGMRQADAAALAGVSITSVQNLERLDFSTAATCRAAQEVAAALDMAVADILPERLHGIAIPTTFSAISAVSPDEMLDYVARSGGRLLLQGPGDILEQKETRAALLAGIKRLAHRDREVIRLRYGLEGRGVHTLDEVARIFNVSRERVRQIEMKAVRKLRSILPAEMEEE